jgi:hypothetical protein
MPIVFGELQGRDLLCDTPLSTLSQTSPHTISIKRSVYQYVLFISLVPHAFYESGTINLDFRSIAFFEGRKLEKNLQSKGENNKPNLCIPESNLKHYLTSTLSGRIQF